ncbi:hypothetical protein [Christiangramia aquimixticola]|uniref:hypothetical protein n=1 Tax=Christiangramia aquimixticola TaxID=1697558 RepID=UPI003AA80DFA
MKTILYLTDFYYQANGRNYYEEDLYITEKLKPHFNVLIGHPHQAISNLEKADVVVFRNTGPIAGYQEYFQEMLKVVKEKNIKTFNSFDGKGDILGKQYLLELTKAGFPVIPTVSNISQLEILGDTDIYVVKLLNGADSIGMEFLTKDQLVAASPSGKIIQPFIDFKYEVSFYFLNEQFQYALYAPDKSKRWKLEEYHPSNDDLIFAEKFINWNGIQHGVTRVDACRKQDGSLLLVELEDLNPFLSIDLLSESKRQNFLDNFIRALKQV